MRGEHPEEVREAKKKSTGGVTSGLGSLVGAVRGSKLRGVVATEKE